MKIKLKFTDEHIALIKAIDFKRIDLTEIMNNFSTIDKEVSIVEKGGGTVEWKPRIGKKKTYEDSDIQQYRLADIIERFHFDLDSLYGVDTFNIWGGTYLWEQIAYIIGIHDHVIKGTEEDPDGPKFPEEDMEHMRDLDCFIVDNLVYIEQILHQFCTEGIQPGVTYWAYDYQLIWHRADEQDAKSGNK